MRVFICAALLIVLSFAGTDAETEVGLDCYVGSNCSGRYSATFYGGQNRCCKRWGEAKLDAETEVGLDCYVGSNCSGRYSATFYGGQNRCCKVSGEAKLDAETEVGLDCYVGSNCSGRYSATFYGGQNRCCKRWGEAKLETAIAQDRAFQIKTVADGFTCRKNQQLQFEPAMTKEECAQMVLDKGSDKGCWKSESGGVVFHLNEEGVDCRCARADYDGKICPKESTSWNGGRESNSIYTIYELAYGDDCTVRGSTIAGSSSWWSCNYDNMATCSSSCCCNPGYVANGDECGKCTAPVFVLANEVTAVRRYVDCDGDDAECDETELNLGLSEDNAHLRKVNKALLKAVQTMNS